LHPLPSLISNPSSLNATGFRVDHNLTRNITLFARYNHAPSYDGTRNWQQLWSTNSNVDTFTAGATFMLSPTKVNDFRANWSRNAASEIISLTNFYGAVVPPISVSFPPGTPYVAGTSRAIVTFPDGFDQGVQQGPPQANVQTQLNFLARSPGRWAHTSSSLASITGAQALRLGTRMFMLLLVLRSHRLRPGVRTWRSSLLVIICPLR
jgi:hypothetical protein